MEKDMIRQINCTKIDTIILKYYPYIDSSNNILDIKDNLDNKNIYKYIKKCKKVIENKYIEVSINDKYARLDNAGTTIYYKKQLYLYIPENIKGVYVLELRMNCNCYTIPHIIDYHSNITYDEIIHQFIDINICYITTVNNTYLEINKKIDTNNIENNINIFINSINTLTHQQII